MDQQTGSFLFFSVNIEYIEWRRSSTAVDRALYIL